LLGNPAHPAGFPLSHSPDCCWLNLKPDISLATKTGHFNLLPTHETLSITSGHMRTKILVALLLCVSTYAFGGPKTSETSRSAENCPKPSDRMVRTH
jgi:hypothetical protein